MSETPSGAHVVVAIASNGVIHEQTLGSVQAMVRATRNAASVEMWWQDAYPGGHCRNLLVDRFLGDKRKTHLLFVDTDMVVPERGLDLLLETGEPLVCGPAPICVQRTGRVPGHLPPFELTTNVMDISDPMLRGTPTDPDDASVRYTRREYSALPDTLFTCDVTGMSFCLIARDVLERMTPPWFLFVERPDRSTTGVDIYFFRKASQLGYRVAVHPDCMCDHIKKADLTHLEQFLVPRSPDPPWTPPAPLQLSRTIVVACTARRWLNLRTSEVLLRWQEELGDRVSVRLLDAGTAGWALARFLHEPATSGLEWERVLLLGPDVVPTPELLHRLSSVDAPIVSSLNRTVANGNVVYSFTRRDPGTGRIEHPAQLPLADLRSPFPVHSVDLACSLVHRGVCKHVVEAWRLAVADADPDRAFNEHLCELVRRDTDQNPVVAPVVVERRADVGLLSLLQLKHRLDTDRKERPRKVAPACV